MIENECFGSSPTKTAEQQAATNHSNKSQQTTNNNKQQQTTTNSTPQPSFNVQRVDRLHIGHVVTPGQIDA
jgi:hypothetical protein